MLLNYIRIALRNIFRNKVYSLINVIGLAIGLAAVILIFLSIGIECSYDNFHVNMDRIFRVGFKEYRNDVLSGDFNSFFAGVGPEIQNNIPEVEKYARISDGNAFFLIHNNKAFEIDNIIYTESSFLDLFDFSLTLGDPKSALTSPSSIVLTQKTAMKFFGDTNPIGEIIQDNNHRPFIVTGVMDNPPINSHLAFNALISFSTLYNDADSYLGWGESMRYKTYVMLYKNAVPSDVEAKFPAFMDRINQMISIPNVSYELYLQPLKDIHLYYDDSSIRITLYIFATIAAFILFIACINFINLTTAISLKRKKEIGIRKVLGAQKKSLIAQFLSESVMMSLIALVIALFLVELAMPTYNNLMEKQIRMAELIGPAHILAFAILVVITGIFAGLYPACRLSSFQPIKTLNNQEAGGRSKVAFRNILVAVQFAISISLISATFLIHSQLKYMRAKDLGFDKKNTIILELKNKELRAHAEDIKNDLKQIPGVIGAAASSQVPSGGFWYNGCLPEGLDAHIYTPQVEIDENYLELYGLKIVRGRNFDESLSTDKDKYMINKSFARQVGWEDPIGKKIFRRGIQHEVIGVVEDFNFAPLNSEIAPLIIMRQPESGRYRTISIKIVGGDIEEILNRIEKVWTDFATDIPFEYFFLDEAFDQIYRNVFKFRKIFFYFSSLAIFIAILGLYGLSACTVEQRTKEIGIRKVLGASYFSIIVLLARGFLLPVVVANFIAIPATYWFMSNILEFYAYRIDVGVGCFVFAGSIALLVAVLTITFHAIKAAVLNPVKTLRYE